ncbi:hypothetical protein ABPG72_022849 [Tetrahymena utriculariae]
MEVEYSNNEGPIAYEVRYACSLLQFGGFSAKQPIDLLLDFDEQAKISVKIAQRIFKQWREEGNVNTHYHHNGNQKYSEQDRGQILEAFENNPKLKVKKQPYQKTQILIISAKHKLELYENRLNAYRIPKILPLSQEQKESRLNFCLQRQRWTVNWQRILFSDECQIQASSIWKKNLKLRNKNEMVPEMCNKQQKDPKKIIVWAIISYQQGPLFIQKVEGTMNKEKYLEILKQFYMKCKKQLSNNCIIQQDNASSHTAKIVKDWMIQKQIELMDWPSNIPDLSPVENIWPHLKEQFYQQMDDNKSDDEMFKKIEKYFYDDKKLKEIIKNAYD